AEKLNCIMAVHGGSYINLGFNTYTVFPATRALGMPFPLAIALTGLMVDGVFDRFPRLRVGFMEGGTAWIPLVLDRLERELEYGGDRRNPRAGGSQERAQGGDSRRERTAVLRSLR